MEEKSIGLDGFVYVKNPLAEGGRYSMAGDPGFSGSDNMGGSSMASNSNSNGRYRAADLSIRTGEEFSMAYSPMVMNGGGIRAENKAAMYWAPDGRKFQMVEGEGNQGLMGQSGNMVSNMADFSERGNLGAEFGGANPYHGGVYGESTRGFHADDVGGGSQKVKLMCSFGGKILPRPSDGALRYVGGETRIITVGRSVGFSELRRKVNEVYGQALVIKYQLPNEDLDALVSVSCDEDIENMMDEYERLMEGSGEGSSRLRLFFFSSSESDLVHLASLGDRKFSEQWYVDAVNGITEMGLRKYGNSSAESLQSLENLIGLDSGGNSNSILPDQGDMSGPLSSRLMTQNVGNSGAPPPISSPISSMAGNANAPSLPSVASSSPRLPSELTHIKQSGLGDSSVGFVPEQQANMGGNAYSAFQPPEGGVGYQDLEYRVPVSSSASFRNESHLKRVESQQEKFDVSQPVMNLRSDGIQPPTDPHRSVLHQSIPSMYWQHPTGANTYMYMQHTNMDGGPAQQPFQQHSLQAARLNNPWPSQQQTDDFFGGAYPDKSVSTQVQAHSVSTTASLQPTSTSQSPHLIRQQIPHGQQHVQMHHPLSSPYLEQSSYGTGLHYYEHSIGAHHALSLPSQYQGQGYEHFMQQDSLHDQLSYPEEHLNHQRVIHHTHSDNFLQKHVTKPVTPMYLGIPISQGNHSDGSMRPAPSNASDSYLHEAVMSPGDHQDMMARGYQTGIQGKEFQPMVSGQQGYTISCGGMEYVVEVPSPPYIQEQQDGANYDYQNRTQAMNFDVVSRGRMAQSEAQQEVKNAEFSGSHLTPAATSSGIVYSEDPYDLSATGSGLSDSYHTYELNDNLESFEPTQFKHTITTGDAGTMSFLRDPVQATRMIARMNEVAVSSSGINVKEVRSINPSEESTIADHESSTNSLLSGAEQQSIDEQFRELKLSSSAPNTEGKPCISSEMSSTWWTGKPGADSDKGDISHIVDMPSGELGEHKTADGLPVADIIAQKESPSNLIFKAEEHPRPLLVETAAADLMGNPTFILPVDSTNTRSSNKAKEAGVDCGPVMLPESLSPQQKPLQVKKTADNDSEYSVTDICSKTSSFDKIKDGNSYSAVLALPVIKSESDSVIDHLKDIPASNVVTSKLTDSSFLTDFITTSNTSPISNISVSTGLLEKEQETYAEEDTMKDGLSVGLSSPELPLSDAKAEGEVTKQELQDFVEDVSTPSIQPNIPRDPAPSLNVWDCPTKDGNEQENTSEIKQLNGVEDEMIIDSDSASEELKAPESNMDESDAVIKEASQLGLQTVMNADLEELRELGSGTFGTVFHGKWRGTDVAIKRIKNSLFAGKSTEQERLRTDFWKEARILAQLHHPNVVAFYGVVPDGPGGTLATVTEFMVNGSLRQVLQRKDKHRGFDIRKRLIISMDAAFGMEYLHGKNIVHFDLKCENLLVNMRDPHRPICKVGDLGLSKIKHQTLVSGGIQGTLPWMAPELLNGGSDMVSEKVDVFSFGIVMWELLTGEEPYANMHYGAIIGGIVSNTLRPTIPPSCDPAWKALMERCWSADPTARPSFTEITNGLRAMAAALPPKGQAQHAQVPAQPQN